MNKEIYSPYLTSEEDPLSWLAKEDRVPDWFDPEDEEHQIAAILIGTINGVKEKKSIIV